MATHLVRRRYRTLLAALSIAAALWVDASQPGRGILDARAAQPRVRIPGQSATLMPDGRWLLIGGLRPDGSAAPPVLVDPRGVDTPVAAALHEQRTGHTATLLADGTVLIIGGVGPTGQIVSSLERFDPGTGQFEALPAGPRIPRAFHSATLISDGRVLIVGGVGSGERSSAETLLMNPALMGAPVELGSLADPRQGHTATLTIDGRVRLSGGSSSANGARLHDQLVDPLTGVVAPAGPPDGPTDFYFAESMPASGAGDVPRDVMISVRFTNAARMASVTDRTVTLSTQGGGLVPVRVVPAESGMLAFVRPVAPLEPGETYTLSFQGVIADGGAPLTASAITFTTEGTLARRPADDEFWSPDAGGRRWTTGRAPSPWQQLPRLQAAPGITAVSGQLLRLNGEPLPRVTLKMGAQTTTSDATGRFLIQPLEGGRQTMLIDGRSASTPGRTYGTFEVGVDVIAGRTNALPYTNWMPRLDTQHAVTINSPTTTETVLTTPYIPGLEVRLPAGTVIRDLDHTVVRTISITPIPTDRPPYPLPAGVNVPVYFTIQPGGAYLETVSGGWPSGARVIYPNYHAWKPGSAAEFWQYDAEDRGWFVYGGGAVNREGTRIEPQPGVALYEFTGAMVGNPFFAPPEAPPTCEPCEDGDPVDLSTGLFVYRATDLFLPDVLPIALTRTYRSRDNTWRAFGVGAMHPYDIYIIGDKNPYTYADVVLADGGRVHYVRTSAGTGFTDAVYEHTATPSRFYKSKISWNTLRQGWDLKFVDGTIYKFPDAEFASIPGQAALVGITDRFGNSVAFLRDSFGALTKITSPNGRWIQFTYDGNDRVIQAQDNLGRTVGYTYDMSGNLWKVTQPGPLVTEFTYDSSHRMIDMKDPRGNIFLTNEYDLAGRVIKQTMADGSTYQFVYTVGTNGKVTRTDVTDPLGYVRSVTFDANGYWLTDTRALGKPEQQTVTVVRNATSHFVTSMTDGLLRQTTLGYDPMGNLTSVTRLANTATPVTTTATYDPVFQQIATVTDPLTHTTTYGRNPQGALTSVEDPLGHQVTFGVNSAGQTTSISDDSGTIGFEYTQGLVTAIIDKAGIATRRTFDGAGRLLTRTDGLGNVTSYVYSPANRLLQVTDALQGITSFTYDENGNLRTLKDPRDGVVSYTYDVMDRVETRTDALSQVERFIYNRLGRLRQSVDRRGFVTTYHYDPLNRVTQISYADGSTTAHTYDAGNRVRQINDSLAGITAIDYDGLDRITLETSPAGSVGYSYDLDGRQSTLSVSGQQPVTYGYDVANRLTSITQGTAVVGIDYDGANRRTLLSLPNATSVVYGYDTASRLASLTYKQGATVAGTLTYAYDLVGRRTEIGGSFARLNLPPALANATYNAGNRLTQWNSTALTYDANGNLLTEGTRTYSWDARNRLEAIGGSTAASFTYDALNRRTGRVVNGAATTSLYDGIHAVQELTNGVVTANLLFGPGVDELLMRTDADGVHTAWADALGSVIALTDGSGAITTTYAYEPFGTTTAAGATSANVSQFTGRDNDRTGLYQLRARYYSPLRHRFISEDPADWRGGVNLYSYAFANPLTFTDPSGLKASEADPMNADGDPMGVPDDSVSASMRAAIAKGDPAEIEMILDAAGDVLQPTLRNAAREFLKDLRSTAQDMIARRCKGSINKVFPEELRNKTLEEIFKLARQGNEAARTAKKLLMDGRFRK